MVFATTPEGGMREFSSSLLLELLGSKSFWERAARERCVLRLSRSDGSIYFTYGRNCVVTTDGVVESDSFDFTDSIDTSESISISRLAGCLGGSGAGATACILIDS